LKVNTIFFFFIFILLISCSSSTDNEKGNYVIQGKLTIQGIPLPDAKVQVDDVLNWTTTSDNSGNFKISGLTAGEHILKASKSQSNDRYVELESVINLTEESTNIGEIRLPIPPTMYDIDTTQVSYNTVPLRWSRSTDPEFREYKVYRRDNPGLDENTGELIFVSTYPSDTTFVDQPPSTGTRYYYRVYILSAFGKLGGSNLINALIPPKNIVRNPNFEESLDGIRPDIWKEDIWNCPSCGGYVTDILLDGDSKHTGIYSGKVVFDGTIFPSDYIDGELALSQRISKYEFEFGKEYVLSVWIKTENLRVWIALVKDHNNWQTVVTLPEFNWIDKNTNWIKYSTTFMAEENNIEDDFWLGIYIDFNSTQDLGYAWIDEVKLQKVTN
jgi:hypothetical protein